MLQGSMLEPPLYSVYTSDLPEDNRVMTATFADDTAILAASNHQEEACDKLQQALDKISNWFADWKIKPSEGKSVHVTYSYRSINLSNRVYIQGLPVPQANSAKYLGMHLDRKLTWEVHIIAKSKQIKKKTAQLYWLIDRDSPLDLYCKRLLYNQIIKPIWTYGIQLWDCAKKCHRDKIQARQNVILRTLVNACQYSCNDDIHKDLNVKTVNEVIKDLAAKHERRLHRHPNDEALQLLITQYDVRRLQRTKPYDLT